MLSTTFATSIQGVKLNRVSPLIVFACLAVVVLWVLTFTVALSPCTVQQYVTDWGCAGQNGKGRKNDLPIEEPLSNKSLTFVVSAGTQSYTITYKPDVSRILTENDELISAAEAKGQFGDFFGVLNSFVGAGTLVMVLLAFEYQRAQLKISIDSANNERLSAAQSRFLNEVQVARSSYYEALRALVISPDQNARSGRQALEDLWGECFITPANNGSGGEDGYPANCFSLTSTKTVGTPGTGSLNMWSPLLRQIDPTSGKKLVAISNPDWVLDQVLSHAPEVQQTLFEYCSLRWSGAAGIHRFRVDTWIRCWAEVFAVFQAAKNDGVPASVVERELRRFRASVTNAELKILLAAATLGQRDSEVETHQLANEYCFFKFFDPGLDPIAHLLRAYATRSVHLTVNPKLNSKAFS